MEHRRPGSGADACSDLKAVSVRRHSSFDLLPVLKVQRMTRLGSCNSAPAF